MQLHDSSGEEQQTGKSCEMRKHRTERVFCMLVPYLFQAAGVYLGQVFGDVQGTLRNFLPASI